MSRHAIFVAVLLGPLVAGGRPRAEERPLDLEIDQIVARPEFGGSTFAILVRRLATGEAVFARNADTLLPPASTTKLVGCAGALAILGADHRFETRLVRTGALDGGVARGDLVLVAVGDPNLSQRVGADGRLAFSDTDHTYAGFAPSQVLPGDPLAVLRRLAREAADAGVREVTGDVIVDDGQFRETRDEFLGVFSAACVNDGVIDVTTRPHATVGERPDVTVSLRSKSVTVDNQARTVAPGSETRLWVEPDPREPTKFTLRGAIAANSPPVLRVGRFVDPARTSAFLLADALEEAGVTIHGSPRRAQLGAAHYALDPAVATHRSLPLREAVRVILKVSHNVHATMLPCFVASERGLTGNRTTGYDLVRSHFESAGLSLATVTLESGSGGGRADRLSPRFLVDLLDYMSRREDFPVFLDALPVAGGDGTLAAHFRAAPLAGRVRAKTGTLVFRSVFGRSWNYESKALAGYLDAGEEGAPDRYGFAILIANTTCDDRDRGLEVLFRAQEDILGAVFEHVRAPEPSR